MNNETPWEPHLPGLSDFEALHGADSFFRVAEVLDETNTDPRYWGTPSVPGPTLTSIHAKAIAKWDEEKDSDGSK